MLVGLATALILATADFTKLMDHELSERLERLESHIAHLERQYEELNQVIIDQAKVIRKLQAHQQRLAESIETSEMERIKATNSKPPHYQ